MDSQQRLRTGVPLWNPFRSISILTLAFAFLSSVTPFYVAPTLPGSHSAFSATRSSSVLGGGGGSGSRRAVTFDRLLVNVGGDFDPDTGRFRCRVAGVYYFAFTVGKYPKKLLSVMLVKNGQEVQAMAYNEYRKQRKKVQSQSAMISLRPMDIVWLLVQDSPDYALYSNAGPYITFSGYLIYPESTSSTGYLNNHLSLPKYSPECPPAPPPPPLAGYYGWRRREAAAEEQQPKRSAFSVARTTSILGESGMHGSSEKAALTFDVEYVNVGGHFNKSSGRFTCHVPGVYFFAFTVGKHPRRAVSVKLMTGRGEVQAMVFDEDTSRNREMQSQSLMLMLGKGDTVWLYSQQDERYAVYSNQGRYTTFTGFLVYPESNPMNPERTFY